MRRDRVLLSAILFSAIWHLFWLSALTVVVVPKDAKPPKFSSVSFLGPILEHSMLGISSSAHERSVPEKRYLSEIENSSAFIIDKAYTDSDIEPELDAENDIFESDGMLTNLAVSIIDGNKIEPGNSQ